MRWPLGVGLLLAAVAVSLVLRAALHPEKRTAAPHRTIVEPREQAKPFHVAQLAAYEEVVDRPTTEPRVASRLAPPPELSELADLPPVCISSLPGIELSKPAATDGDDEPLLTASKQQLPLTAPTREFSLNPHPKASAAWHDVKQEVAAEYAGLDPHAELFAKDCYPSATACRKCHEQIYEEWAISSHANAAISPMFHRFEQKLNALSQGTLGYFCVRCHAPVATTMKHPRWASIGEGPRVFREGVTCVACHRVVEQYAKTNGERRMEPGPIESPTVGASNGEGLANVLARRSEFKVKTDPGDKLPGQLIHNRVVKFEQLSESTYCMSCHQVAVQPGIKLEVVWEQYRHSPAYRQGIRCQDCHMGRVPGKADGFCEAYVAVIEGKPSGPPRKHSNHVFFGPGSSIAHPGLFPQNPEADRWSMQQWLTFDWRASWGTEAFEDAIERGQIQATFPPEWAETDDRRDARDVLEKNFKRLAIKQELRRQTMENGSKIEGPYFAYGAQRDDGSVPAARDLHFHYLVSNTNSGHNLPTGSLGAQPQLWLNAVLVAPSGRKVWESGYLDTQGDLADIHSIDMHQGRVPFDRQLFNLQTKFLITNVKGTDREIPLPVNIDVDQLPFLRPAPQPVSVLNHPPLIRMEQHSISPCGSRPAKYHIPASALCEPGVYRLSVRMRSRGEPIYFMKFVDSTPEMIRSMNESILDVHPRTVAFEVR
jgi:nitrate/TMAO reductase-like tetraheme cytochrome c subunit